MDDQASNNTDPQEPQAEGSGNSGEDNVRVIAALAYVIFFIPMLTHKDNAFAMFHANQGLNLLLTAIVVNTLGWLIPVIGWFIILPFGSIFVFVLFIIGVANALNEKTKQLPIIGGFQILN